MFINFENGRISINSFRNNGLVVDLDYFIKNIASDKHHSMCLSSVSPDDVFDCLCDDEYLQSIDIDIDDSENINYLAQQLDDYINERNFQEEMKNYNEKI